MSRINGEVVSELVVDEGSWFQLYKKKPGVFVMRRSMRFDEDWTAWSSYKPVLDIVGSTQPIFIERLEDEWMQGGEVDILVYITN